MSISAFRTAFWALSAALMLPLSIFVGLEFGTWIVGPPPDHATHRSGPAERQPTLKHPDRHGAAPDSSEDPAATGTSTTDPYLADALDGVESALTGSEMPDGGSMAAATPRTRPRTPSASAILEAQTRPEPGHRWASSRAVEFRSLGRSAPLPEPSSPGLNPLEIELARLRNEVRDLSQQHRLQQMEQLQQATQLLHQVHQSSKLQELEQKVQSLATQAERSAVEEQQRLLSAQAEPSEDGLPDPEPRSTPNKSRTTRTLQTAATDDSQTEPEIAEENTPGLKIVQTSHRPPRWNLSAENVEVRSVLQRLAQLSEKNILVSDDVAGPISAQLNGVDPETAWAAILKTADLVAAMEGNCLLISTRTGFASRQRQQIGVQNRMFRPQFLSANDLGALIAPLLTPGHGKLSVASGTRTREQATAGGVQLADYHVQSPLQSGKIQHADLEQPVSNAGPRSGSAWSQPSMPQPDALLVQDYPEVLEQIDRILTEMDQPPLQVMIEAHLLSVKLNDKLRAGLNLGALGCSVTREIDPADVEGPGFNGGTEVGLAGISFSGGSDLRADSSGLKCGTLQVSIAKFVRAIEQVADVSVVASPRIIALNRQPAELLIGARLGYRPVSRGWRMNPEPLQYATAGTRLALCPQISQNGLVRLQIHPERSSALFAGSNGVPQIATSELTTDVLIRDGDTIVLGGMIEEQLKTAVKRTPVLSQLPVVGGAFRSRAESTERTELIILLTPRIVREGSVEAEGLAARCTVDQQHSAVREQMSSANRRHEAHAAREWARRYLDAGDFVRAQSSLQSALELYPYDPQALHLQQLLEQRLQGADAIGATASPHVIPDDRPGHLPLERSSPLEFFGVPGKTPPPTRDEGIIVPKPSPWDYRSADEPIGPQAKPNDRKPQAMPGVSKSPWGTSPLSKVTVPPRTALPPEKHAAQPLLPTKPVADHPVADHPALHRQSVMEPRGPLPVQRNRPDTTAVNVEQQTIELPALTTDDASPAPVSEPPKAAGSADHRDVPNAGRIPDAPSSSEPSIRITPRPVHGVTSDIPPESTSDAIHKPVEPTKKTPNDLSPAERPESSTTVSQPSTSGAITTPTAPGWQPVLRGPSLEAAPAAANGGEPVLPDPTLRNTRAGKRTSQTGS